MMFKNTLLALLVASAAAFAPSPRVAFGVARSHTALSMSAEVSDKVRQIIATQLGVDVEKVTPAATFVDDLGADSLDTVEIIMAIEEGFDVEIPEEDATNISTVQEVIDFLSK
jgi:acyl carrier protein